MSGTPSPTVAALCCAGLALNGVALASPNVLLIVADDQGLDASAQYALSDDLPSTPHLDTLADAGLVFDNAWATPSCTTTRGTLLTGLHGRHSGVDHTPARLDTEVLSLQQHLTTTTDYATAVVGKWHLAGGRSSEYSHPTDLGVGYFAGTLNGVLEDYSQWNLATSRGATQSTEYHTTVITDLALEWVAEQGDKPWFLWTAYAAPHAPFHLPPADLHTRDLGGTEAHIRANPRDYYLAAIEAMDSEIGRLLTGLPPDVRDNTLVIYIGDNGTPGRVIDADAYNRSRAKGSLYEGGIRVPLVVSGAGVTRAGERDAALVNSVDLFATVSAVVGAPAAPALDSVSFAPLLSGRGVAPRRFNYSEFQGKRASGWAVRDAQLKLIEFDDGSRELYDLVADPREETNLMNTKIQDPLRVAALAGFALAVQSGQVAAAAAAGDDVVDITNALLTARSGNCADYAQWQTASTVRDVNNNATLQGALRVSVADGACSFESNAIPNHDLNDGARRFRNPVSEQSQRFTVTSTPEMAGVNTALSLRVDNAVLLNGVKVDLLAAGCFGVRDGRIGCNDPDQPWRYDPMFRANGFGVDSHNAHTQPDGTYHYHGPPNALYDAAGDSPSPVVGFAADGFPIYGSLITDDSAVRSVTSSYRLKSGSRPSGAGYPGGQYDGAFRDDFEYVPGLGDLDECNGMTVDGQYGYYITDTYPWLLACFKGTPHESFRKSRGR